MQGDPPFLRGGGVMGALIRAHDWTPTLGPPETWPAPLQGAVAIMLAAAQPMFVAWGPRLSCLYNDAFIPLAVHRHPVMLGQPHREHWPEVWAEVGNAFAAALAGEGRFITNRPVVTGGAQRTFSYSLTPLFDGAGPPQGFLIVVTETGARGAAERRDALLRALDDALRGAEPAALLADAARLVGEHLGAGRAGFVEFTGEARRMRVLASWTAGALAAAPAGFEASVPLPVFGALNRGDTVALADLRADARANAFAAHPAFQSLDSRAMLGAPFLEDGALRGLLAVEDAQPRAWTAEETQLVREVAERAFAGLARARAEAAERAAADALAARTRELERITLAAPAMIYINDRRRRRTEYVNEGVTRLLGYTPAEIYALPPGGVTDLLHPDDREAAIAMLAAVGASGDDEARTAEYRMRRADGGYVWLLDRVVPLERDPDGGLARVLGVALDISDRKRAEAARAEAETERERTAALLEAIGESSPDLIYAKDVQGRMLYANAATLAVLGKSAAEVIGRTSIEYGDLGDGGDAHLENDLRVIATGEPLTIDEPFQRPGLERRIFQTAKAPLRDASGAVVGVVGITSDVTERRAAEARAAVLLALEERLRAGESPLAATAEVLGEALVVQRAGYAIAEDDEHLVVDQEWRRGATASGEGRHRLADYGAPMEALLRAGETAGIADTEDDPLVPTPAARAAFRAIRTRATLTVPVMRGGRLAATVYVAHEFPRRWTAEEIALARELADRAFDAVDRERAVRALNAAEERLRLAIDAAGVGLWDVDPIADRLFWPASVKAMFGIPADAHVTMQDYYDGVHPDDAARTFAAYVRAIDPAIRELYDVEYRTVGRDGVVRWVAAKGRGVFDADNRCVRVIGTAIDITARKAQEAALRELNATLERRVAEAITERETALAQLHEAQKLEVIGQLTGGVAHDFNNLLQPVIGGLDLLKRRERDERSARLIEGALQSAERAKTLVARLLAFARRQTLQPRPTDVGALIASMLDLIERSVGPRIAVRLAIAPDLPAALVDPNQLELAILNLAVNARDAMPDGGRLTIAATADPETITLAITDTGIGMDDATLARAIEPFFSTKATGKGTGLGLSMVHGLAAQSGGSFTLASAAGRGTTATLQLPATDATPERPATPSVVQRAASPARLLLVDDDAPVRATTAAALQELGYTVAQAANAADALVRLDAEGPFDALVTDHLMPGVTGLDLARRLAAERPDLPVLVISGFANLPPDAARGVAMLAKPFSLADLASRVARLLAGA